MTAKSFMESAQSAASAAARSSIMASRGVCAMSISSKFWTEWQAGIGKGGLLCIENDSPIADLASLESYREVDLFWPEDFES
jgi:hypothetical protein